MLLASSPLRAGGGTVDALDMATLPPYCPYAPGDAYSPFAPRATFKAELERWKRILGQMHAHIHHYCNGMLETNRALFRARNPRERSALLRSSINQFEYVIRRARSEAPGWILLPEALTKRGENYIRLGLPGQGTADLLHAIEAKPDYWPPYVALVDHYLSIGDKAKAREWLDKGLAAAPDAGALRSRLAALDNDKGKPSARAPANGAEASRTDLPKDGPERN